MQAGASSYTHEKVSPAVSRSHGNRHGGKDGVRSTRCGVEVRFLKRYLSDSIFSTLWRHKVEKTESLSKIVTKSQQSLLNKTLIDLIVRGHSQRTSGKMLDFLPPLLSLVRHCPNLITPSPLGHPACFKNLCNFRFVIIIISLTPLKTHLVNFLYY